MIRRNQPAIILGVEPRITVPVARSLHQIGIPVLVASISPGDPTPHSRAIRDFVRLPRPDASSDEFLSALSAYIKTKDVEMLVPVTDMALSAVSEHFDKLSLLLHVACPSPAIVNRVLNKEATLSAAAQCGIRIPREYVIKKPDGFASVPQMVFPVIAKPRQKSVGESFKIRYFHNQSQLTEAIKNGVLDDAIVQEYCDGEGVGVEMLIHKGTCVAAFQHRRLAEFPHTGGVAVKAVAEAVDPQLRDMALRLLLALQWEGVAMVEFRHDRQTGRAALMEVNGRYWGTVSLPIQAGIDFPVYQWQLIHGEVPQVPIEYSTGVIWRWTAGSLKRWHGKLRARRPNIGTAAAPTYPAAPGKIRDALWTLDDPGPAIFEFFNVCRALLRSDARAVVKRMLPKRPAAAVGAGKSLQSAAVQRGED